MAGPGGVQGASPAGIAPGDEREAARAVREMFGRVAPRYDLLNHLLSAQVDVYWRKCLVRAVRPYLRRPGLRVADLCCGTGDLAVALGRECLRLEAGQPAVPLAADFCWPMLVRARAKLAGARLPWKLAEADATRMPLSDASLDLVTIAYGFRNLASYAGGAAEFRRVLAPGGCLAMLEFSQPESALWGALFGAYFRHVLPRLGNLVAGGGNAYSYLHESVERFPAPTEIRALLLDSGFSRVDTRSLTGGVSILYLAYV